jgi:hypothetical protein
MFLTLLVEFELDLSFLLAAFAPFSISQRFPRVGLPRAARACKRSRRNEKSGNVNDDLFRRIFYSSAKNVKTRSLYEIFIYLFFPSFRASKVHFSCS